MNGSSLLSLFALRRRTTSMPSIFGIITSRRIRSGQERSTASKAACPSLAPSTTYPRASSRARSSSILSSWSSTTRIRPLRSIVLAEESLHLRDNGSRLTGLGEVSIAADLHRLLAIGRECVGGERDDGDPFRR